MPSVELDLKHWVKVVPSEGQTQTVKALGAACYYANTPNPPELGSEGTEVAEAGTVTLELPSGKWFLAKAAGCILEREPAVVESTGSSQLAKEAVTAAKIKAEAVEEAKIKAKAVSSTKVLPPTIPAATGTESLTATLGTAGVTRSVIAIYNAKAEASAKVKIKHGLETEYVAVTAWKASAGKATEKITDGAAVAGAISKVKYTSASEIELTLVATEPAGKEELFYIVTG